MQNGLCQNTPKNITSRATACNSFDHEYVLLSPIRPVGVSGRVHRCKSTRVLHFRSANAFLQQLNKVLEAAFKGTEFSKNTFWLPSSEDDYSDAPKKVPRKPTEGTKPPVSSYKSPFIGWKGEDVAKWLKSKPEEAAIDVHFFAIVDKSAEKGFLVIGRQGGRYLKDMDELEFMRLDTEFATASIYAAQSGTWEEIKTSKGLAEIEY